MDPRARTITSVGDPSDRNGNTWTATYGSTAQCPSDPLRLNTAFQMLVLKVSVMGLGP